MFALPQHSQALLAAMTALAELSRPRAITASVHVPLFAVCVGLTVCPACPAKDRCMFCLLCVCSSSVSSLALLAAMPALAELARPCVIHAPAHVRLRLLILLDHVRSPHWCTCDGVLFAYVLLFAWLGLQRAAAYLLAACVRLLCCLSCAACCDGRAC